jgi:group I intron endonuclease
MNSGIYEIRHGATGATYVGSANDVGRRFMEHRKALRRGNHANPHLQHAWAKYGEGSFTFQPVESCAPADLISTEQRHLDATIASRGRDAVFNICLIVERSRLGVRVSEESRRRMSEAKRGTLTPERQAIMAAGRVGLKRSQEAKDKTAAKHRGVKRSAEACARMSAKAKGRVVGMEQRAKLSAALKGRAFTPEHRARAIAGIRAAHARRAA